MFKYKALVRIFNEASKRLENIKVTGVSETAEGARRAAMAQVPNGPNMELIFSQTMKMEE